MWPGYSVGSLVYHIGKCSAYSISRTTSLLIHAWYAIGCKDVSVPIASRAAEVGATISPASWRWLHRIRLVIFPCNVHADHCPIPSRSVSPVDCSSTVIGVSRPAILIGLRGSKSIVIDFGCSASPYPARIKPVVRYSTNTNHGAVSNYIATTHRTVAHPSLIKASIFYKEELACSKVVSIGP